MKTCEELWDRWDEMSEEIQVAWLECVDTFEAQNPDVTEVLRSHSIWPQHDDHHFVCLIQCIRSGQDEAHKYSRTYGRLDCTSSATLRESYTEMFRTLQELFDEQVEGQSEICEVLR
jgi:hypothetical protein